MSPGELNATRKALFLTVAECADNIGKCSIRHWQYLEAGKRPIEPVVSDAMRQLIKLRDHKILYLLDWPVLPYCPKLYQYKEIIKGDTPRANSLIVDWRLYQSAITHLYFEGHTTLT